jgi:hypothetical protein
VIPAKVESYPYLMTDSVKRWLIFDATSENKDVILKQVASAENQKLYHYFVYFDGGSYEIEGGNLKGSVGNPHGNKGALVDPVVVNTISARDVPVKQVQVPQSPCVPHIEPGSFVQDKS